MSNALGTMPAQHQRPARRPWRLPWRSLGLVAGCALIGGGMALLAGALRTQPLYQASATVAVALATTAGSTKNASLNATLVPSYAQLAITRPVLISVAAKHPEISV